MVIAAAGAGVRQGMERGECRKREGTQPKREREERKSALDFTMSQRRHLDVQSLRMGTKRARSRGNLQRRSD